jgi:peptidoglycan/LPS O-acetylase OafA/YrhL
MKSIKQDVNIDILRGISILLVFIYHLKLKIFQFTLFEGGYLGVDIFFVISGYLITSILFLNTNNKKFSLKTFFKRRFLRIFPAYIILIFLTLLISYLILLPDQLVYLADSVIPSVLFISNFHFWRVLNDYFAMESIMYPLLHTWSLSIEIQYYISISFFFIILKKININPKIPLLITGFLSLTIATIFSYLEPQINFFGFQSRLWEFIIGSFIFFYRDKINLKISLFSKYIIYFIIFIFALLFNETVKHPSIITFIFLIFVSILILNKNIYKESNSDKFFKFFGLISYSLYIWHYPIISFSDAIIYKFDNFDKFFILLLCVFLSYISYNFIEKKLKHDTLNTYLIVLFAFIASVVLTISIQNNAGFNKRLNFNKLFNQVTTQGDVLNFTNNVEDNFNFYSDNNILIIGNSHSIQTYKGFISNKQMYKNINFSNFHIQVACFKEFTITNNRDHCKGYFDTKAQTKFLQGIKKFKNSKYILISTRWTNEDLIALPEVINFLRKNNKRIIIFNSITDINKNHNFDKLMNRPLTFLEKNLIKNNFTLLNFLYLNNRQPSPSELVEFEKEYFLNKSKHSVSKNNKLKIISKKLNVDYFDLNKYICDDNLKRCKVLTDNNKHIMIDSSGHLGYDAINYLYKIISKDFIDLINK